ncbi:MAG: putative NagC family transcriptional regulator [Acidimicrobiaceae bacterium]|nr:putative NagC family transcriptional regulator [Acidimicrobiaceae bacterium]
MTGALDRPRAATTRSVAQANAALIVDTLREHGGLARSELVRITGLSRATVNRLSGSLLAEGLIMDDRQSDSTGGRPARQLRYNGLWSGVLAFDLGPHKITGAVIDMAGAFIHREIRPTVKPGAMPDPRQIYDTLVQFALDLLDFARKRCPTAAIAVSVPGRVQEGGLVEFAPALQWWSMPLGDLLQERLGVPVLVENDVNVLALVEHRQGAGAGCADMVAISIGTGIGAGVVLGNQLRRGWQGGAGELGYLLLEPASLDHAWPGFGDLESRLGRTGIARRAEELGVAETERTLEGLQALAASGHEGAAALVRAITDEVAFTVANICVLLSPEVVALGGQVGRTMGDLLPAVRSRLTGRIPSVPRLVLASVADAEVVGAAELARDHVLAMNSLRSS